MRKIDVLHLGLPRASSTTLQVNLFAKSSQIYPANNDHESWARKLALDDQTSWGSASPGIKNYISDWSNTTPANTVSVISCEGFCLPSPAVQGLNRHGILQRVHTVAGAPKRILLVLREQKSWFKSLYWHTFSGLLRSAQVGSLHDVPAELVYEIISKRPFAREGWSLMASEAMDLYDIVVDIESVFPDTQLHIVPFEWLRSEPARYFAAIGKAVGIDEKEVQKAYDLPAKKQNLTQAEMSLFQLMYKVWPRAFWPSNVFIRRRIGPVASRINNTSAASDWSLPELLAAKINDRSREQNQLLQKHTGLDLSSLGYPV